MSVCFYHRNSHLCADTGVEPDLRLVFAVVLDIALEIDPLLVHSAAILGGTALADDVEILDTTSEGLAGTVRPSRLSGTRLSLLNVRYYTLNEKGEIDRLILNDVTGDLWKYGVLDDIKNLAANLPSKSTSSGGGGSYYAPTVPDMPMLYRGCTGDAVKTLQEKLNAEGFDSGNVDGIFGAKTYAAVTAFQKANGLGVDGIVGKLTWGKLYGVSPAMPVETTTVVGRPMVSYGSRGDAVRKLQELLNALGYDCGSVDGIFGSKTKAAVLAFQKANGLGADGIVGPLTWGKLV